MAKSWFSNHIETKRSNFLPFIELVGLKVKAVARAAATADAAVDVYCVWAWQTVAKATVVAQAENIFIFIRKGLAVCTEKVKCRRRESKTLCVRRL
jgi:hypothetical protein